MLRKLLSFQFILFIAYVGCKAINLKKISTLYVPSSYSDTGTPLFSPKAKSSEQLAYDTQSKFVYVVGKCPYLLAFLSTQCNEFEKKVFRKKIICILFNCLIWQLMPILNVQVLVIKTLFKYKVLKLSLFMISVIPDFSFKNIYKKRSRDQL